LGIHLLNAYPVVIQLQLLKQQSAIETTLKPSPPLFWLKAVGMGHENCYYSQKTELQMQGQTIHDIKMIVLTMFLGNTVFCFSFTLFTNIGVKQDYILCSDEV
jgi:hypothetical protein